MVSKFIIERNKFIASLVKKHCEQLDCVLDLGCGEGNILKYIELPIYYRGVDLNYIGGSRLIENADILQWEPKYERQYNVIILQEVLEHLPLPDIEYTIPLLEKIRNWMYDDSVLIISVPNFMRLTNRLTKNKRYLDDTHNMEYFGNILDMILYGTGYNIIERHHWLLYLPFEKYIGWMVPEFVRNFILKHHPTLCSHIIYICKKNKG